LDFVLPAYVTEGKTHLTIAIGCTGGKHRSVTVADRIARHLAGRDDVSLRVVHRDVALDSPRPGPGRYLETIFSQLRKRPCPRFRSRRLCPARPGDDDVPPAEGAATAGQRLARGIDARASETTARARERT